MVLGGGARGLREPVERFESNVMEEADAECSGAAHQGDT